MEGVLPVRENRDAPAAAGPASVVEVVGVERRSGDGEAGDSGRRNGELREGGEL